MNAAKHDAQTADPGLAPRQGPPRPGVVGKIRLVEAGVIPKHAAQCNVSSPSDLWSLRRLTVAAPQLSHEDEAGE